MQRSKLSNNAVIFRDVSISLAGVDILKNVSASVPRGKCTAIVGPNGAGKTSLLMALLGQISCSGSVTIEDCPEHGAPRIGYMPQKLNFDRSIPMTVMDFLAMGIQRLPLWIGTGKRHKQAAMDQLEAVSAGPLATRMLGALSGGELQRVLLALALQQNPDLLILDEPASGVDIQGGHLFCELLERLRKEHKFTQLMVSHDLATVTHHASHVIMLQKTLIAEGPPREVLTTENLTALFGIHMGLANAGSMPDGRTACTCERVHND